MPAEGSSIKVSKVGEGSLPSPPEVEPWVLAADDAEAEKWEGVPITLKNVRVHAPPRSVSSSDETLREMTVTGPFRVSSNLGPLDPEAFPRGACLSSITGIGDYFFNYKLSPRGASDIVVGGDGDCLPVEETLELCGDQLDNDYNGFADCLDYGCQLSAVEGVRESCVKSATVTEIQTGAVDSNALVRLTDVVVSGRSFNGKRFWVMDSSDAAPHSGVYLWQPSEGATELPAEIGIGAHLNLVAKITEFKTLTQLVDFEISDVVAGPAPVPLTVGLSDVVGANAKVYESVLIYLPALNAKVTSVETAMVGGAENVVGFVVEAGGDTLRVDDDIFRYSEVAVGDCIAELGGIMHFNVFDGVVVLLPRSAAEVLPGTSCE